MGTSSAYGGPNNSTPLIPSWLEPGLPLPVPPDQISPGSNGQELPPTPEELPNAVPQIQLPLSPDRFRKPRTDFSRFLVSDGNDKGGLYRAVSGYVSRSSGGSRVAARRMGSSRRSASRLLGFLSSVVSDGVKGALRLLNLEDLAGRPIDDIFLGMMDHVCPDGGNIDEGIARDAFTQTIADLASNGVTNINALIIEQLITVLELYITHTIEYRIYNDIATKVIQLPSNIHLAIQLQAQLADLIRRGVSDALANELDSIRALRQDNTQNLVNRVYETTFAIVQDICESGLEAIET